MKNIVLTIATALIVAPVIVGAVTYGNIQARFDLKQGIMGQKIEGLKVGQGATLYPVFDNLTGNTCYVVEGKTIAISCVGKQTEFPKTLNTVNYPPPSN